VEKQVEPKTFFPNWLSRDSRVGEWKFLFQRRSLRIQWINSFCHAAQGLYESKKTNNQQDKFARSIFALLWLSHLTSEISSGSNLAIL